MAEKRADKRFAKRLSVRFGEKDFGRQGITHDISASGAFVVAQVLPPLDTRLHLQISTGVEGGFFCMEGEVRRHKLVPAQLRQLERGGFGVRFLLPSELMGELLPNAPKGPRFEASFETAEQLTQTFEQQIRRGGLLVNTDQRLERDADVTVMLRLEFVERVFAVQAKVVQFISGSTQGLAVSFPDRGEIERLLTPFLKLK